MLRRIGDVDQDSSRPFPLESSNGLQSSENILTVVIAAAGLERTQEGKERGVVRGEVVGCDAIISVRMVAVTDEAKADLKNEMNKLTLPCEVASEMT